MKLERIYIRCTPAQKAAYEAAAGKQGISAWLLVLADKQAEMHTACHKQIKDFDKKLKTLVAPKKAWNQVKRAEPGSLLKK